MHKGDPTVLTVSPPESGFLPRREFVPENHVPSTFALLALAGPGLVRLTSFSPEAIVSIKSYLAANLRFRSRAEQELDLIEISLSGNPWTKAKSAETERLFVDLFSVILQHGYKFLSTLDYGRDPEDRVSVAFSKPVSVAIPQPIRVPFALSFVSSKTLRVINPPLHSTPAILQAARSSWPKGIISERKASDRCFEFRLRGAGWFHADTFALDAQQQIFSLLSSLDRHTFSLLASLSLSGKHSKMKDLWIFSGLPEEFSSHSSNNEELHNALPIGISDIQPPPSLETSRLATNHMNGSAFQEPSKGHTFKHAHARSFSENDAKHLAQHGQPGAHTDLRPNVNISDSIAARKQLNRISEEGSFTRKDELSPRSSVDMTGIGAGIRRMFVSNRSSTGPSLSNNHESRYGKNEAISEMRSNYEVGGGIKSGDVQSQTAHSNVHEADRANRSPNQFRPASHSYGEDYALFPSPSSRESQGQYSDRSNSISQAASDRLGSRVVSDFQSTIMNSGVFRDSAFSSNTDHSYEFSRAWTDIHDKDKRKSGRHFTNESKSSPGLDEGFASDSSSEFSQGAERRSITKYFGRRQSTPMAEIPEERASLATGSIPDDFPQEQRNPTKKVDAERVATPEMSDIPGATRKSEAAIYESTTNRRTNADVQKRKRDGPNEPPSQRQEGWVLVTIKDNVEQRPVSPFKRLLSLSKSRSRFSASSPRQSNLKGKRK